MNAITLTTLLVCAAPGFWSQLDEAVEKAGMKLVYSGNKMPGELSQRLIATGLRLNDQITQCNDGVVAGEVSTTTVTLGKHTFPIIRVYIGTVEETRMIIIGTPTFIMRFEPSPNGEKYLGNVRMTVREVGGEDDGKEYVMWLK